MFKSTSLQICKDRVWSRASLFSFFFSVPNLRAYTILRRLWSHLWPSCALMKNSTALCRGQRSLTPFHPEPSNVHLEQFTRAERYWINRLKKKRRRKRHNLGNSGKSPLPTSRPPLFSILVLSKVFARVLIGRDDLEIIVTGAAQMRGAMFT